MAQQQKKSPARPPPPQKTPSSALELANARYSTSVLDLLNIVTWQDFQRAHDAAYCYIDDGLKFDKANNVPVAIENYTKGLVILNTCIEIDVALLLGCSEMLLDNARKNQIKMSKTKQEITFRLQLLQEKTKKPTMATAPPSYEEAVSQTEHPPPYNEDDLTQLGEILMRRELSTRQLSNAEEIFYIPDGVQLYFISAEGLISAPTYPTSLQVLRLMKEPGTKINPVFIIVGDWIYPLLPGQSPALESSYGAYLFPDTTAPGAAIALMLPDNLSNKDRSQFHALLDKLTALEVQSCFHVSSSDLLEEDESTESISEMENLSKVSKGILIAAKWISWGLIKGAEKGRNLIQGGSQMVRERTRKCSIDRPVDPNFLQGVVYARQATGGVVQVTSYVVNKLGEATVYVAREIAPILREKTMNVLPRSLSEGEAGSPSAIDTVIEVAASGIKGFAKVYGSLEKAAKCLGSSIADESVKVVQHSYGAEAAQLTENTMHVAGNVIMATHNVKSLGIKAIAKKTAKETGTAVYDELLKAKGTTV